MQITFTARAAPAPVVVLLAPVLTSVPDEEFVTHPKVDPAVSSAEQVQLGFAEKIPEANVSVQFPVEGLVVDAIHVPLCEDTAQADEINARSIRSVPVVFEVTDPTISGTLSVF